MREPRDLSRYLLRDDAFLIDSMRGTNTRPVITSETEVGGETLRHIMERNSLELYLDLQPKNGFESVLTTHIVRATAASTECFNKVERHMQNAESRGVYLGLVLKSAEKVTALTDLLEGYRARSLDTKDAVQRRGEMRALFREARKLLKELG